MSSEDLWKRCLQRLETRLPPREATTWLRPIQSRMVGGTLWLHAPNRFVQDHVESEFLPEIRRVLAEVGGENLEAVRLTVGFESFEPVAVPDSSVGSRPAGTDAGSGAAARNAFETNSNTNPGFRFDNFVQGKSNEFAFATSWQVAENPGVSYNPLFLYGGVGLGKTHLMHAIGNTILERSPGAKVYYLHSERFVADMIKALQHNSIDAFKAHYRSATALLIDDIQFFAHKERSQEEFFHTFNALIENHQQVVLTSDRYPKELEGLEERLKSRFSWGVAAHIDPPELETRVAILQHKAESSGIDLPSEVAFFMAKRIRSNVRELEGSLRRVIANAQFTRKPITVDFAKEALRDLLAAQERAVTLENIQKTVAEFYRIRTSDLVSSKRSRSIARPRQMAMALAKELTQHSLPEIGEAFGGRDHTTVMHAIRKINELRDGEEPFENDYRTLIRILT